MKCAGFLVSTYSKLCHVIWCPTICCAAWVSNNPRATVVQIGGHLYERRLTDKRREEAGKSWLQTASRWPLRYKGKQWIERRAVLWLNHFHNPQRSCARATGEEEKEEENTKCRKCHGRFLRAGAFSRERMGIIVFCIVHTFASTVVFAQFPLCRTLSAVFHCITVCKQPPSSLHRRHYRDIW